MELFLKYSKYYKDALEFLEQQVGVLSDRFPMGSYVKFYQAGVPTWANREVSYKYITIGRVVDYSVISGRYYGSVPTIDMSQRPSLALFITEELTSTTKDNDNWRHKVGSQQLLDKALPIEFRDCCKQDFLQWECSSIKHEDMIIYLTDPNIQVRERAQQIVRVLK
jgi:hypothetical protein